MTERNTSLHSGSIDSVQTSEAQLQKFEAVAKAEAFALKWGSAPNPANFEKFDQTFPLLLKLKFPLAEIHLNSALCILHSAL